MSKQVLRRGNRRNIMNVFPYRKDFITGCKVFAVPIKSASKKLNLMRLFSLMVVERCSTLGEKHLSN